MPHDHFYRHVERTLDLTFVREFVHKTYAHGGRPSIDRARVLAPLHLVMFFEGIRTRYGIEVFRRFFEQIVEQCQQAGLVWGHKL